jgi:hypothetical protein
MFRATVLPIIRGIGLCDAACGMKHPMSFRPAVWQRRNSVTRPPAVIVAPSWFSSLPSLLMMRGQTNIKLIGISCSASSPLLPPPPPTTTLPQSGMPQCRCVIESTWLWNWITLSHDSEIIQQYARWTANCDENKERFHLVSLYVPEWHYSQHNSVEGKVL